MASLVIRNIDQSVLDRIEELAKKKKLSRETYLRNLLNNLYYSGEIADVENKYELLMKQTLEMLQYTSDVLEHNTRVLENIEDKLED